MNWDKAFILVIDKGGLFSNFNENDFHTSITSAKGIKSWWHYIDNTYILIVERGVTPRGITNLVVELIPNRRFFVCEIVLSNHNGWLPQEAWDWIISQIK